MSLLTPDREEIIPQWRARLEDTMSASTRGKRRLLLVTGTIALVVVILGLFPTKIEALGIAFESKNQRDLLLLLFFVNVYAFAGFILYAWADFLLQRRIQANASTGYINEFVKGEASWLESINYRVRFSFDYIVPAVYGSYAVFRLNEVLWGAASAV